MFGKNIGRKTFTIVLILVFSFVPINPSFFMRATAQSEEDIPAMSGEVSGDIFISEYTEVREGETLFVSAGSTIIFSNNAGLQVEGILFIEGTPQRPVTIQSGDGTAYSISVISSGKVYARNVDVSDGGSSADLAIGGERKVFSRAMASFRTGAFSASSGGVLDIENAYFHDNTVAISADPASSRGSSVQRSKFLENDYDIAAGGNFNFDARYNWWGSAAGPEVMAPDYPVYKKISSRVTVSPWVQTEYFRDPVIIVPGILGSWKITHSGELQLDPILHIFDDLIETLEENGYKEGVNLFTFPYDWLKSNEVTADKLKIKIDAVLTQTGWPRADIVAHSMGGLVAREYVSKYGDKDIDQLVTMGTPHSGAPEDYLVWEGGEFYDTSFIRKSFGTILLRLLSEENGYLSIFDFIRDPEHPVESVREMLPVYSYLRNAEEPRDLRTYPDRTPQNPFLEHLSLPSEMEKLMPLVFTNIIGKTKKSETIETIRVGKPSIELLADPNAKVLWGHGMPDGYDDTLGDHGLELGEGDGTVPIASARSEYADETIEVKSSHGRIPSKAAKSVVKALTGFDALSGSPLLSSPANSYLFIVPFSPIDIQVVSPTGKRIGKNFHPQTGEPEFWNEIDGAYYSGFDTEYEFISIPNPADGEYEILAEGTEGGGAYRIEATKVTEDETTGEAAESTAEIAGEAMEGEMEDEGIVAVTADGVESEGAADTAAPEITITSPEEKTYQNSETVSVLFEVSDDVSPRENISVETKLDGAVREDADIDLSLLPLGEHALSAAATDEAGNANERAALFTTETSWESLGKNIAHYGDLGLITNKRTEKILARSADRLSRAVDRLEKYSRYFQRHPRARKVFIVRINRAVSLLQEYIRVHTKKGIDRAAAKRLTETLDGLMVK